LAGYEDENSVRSSIGRILDEIPKNELKPAYTFPEKFPDFIRTKMDDVITGSMVAILGLNKQWDKNANYAIVSNFFYAIYQNELSVEISHESLPVEINKDLVEYLLAKYKDGKMATGDKILANQDIYQSWITIKNLDYKKNIELDNGDKVCVHIRNGIETDSVIALIRNGMLIARHDKMLSRELASLRKSDDFEAFSMVINVDKNECPKLFDLVKGAENPYHNRLEKDRLSPKEEKQLKALFKELSEKIKINLKAKDRENFNLSMPLLEIPNQAEAQGASAGKPRSQTAKAKANTNKPKPPTGKPRITKKGKKRPAPIIVSRFLEARNSMKMTDNGDTIDVKLNITPQKMEAKDEVYLSISLAQDKDNNEGGSALDFVNLSIDGAAIEIPEFVEIKQKDGNIEKQKADKCQIKLGQLAKLQTYEIMATIKKPKKLKDIGVALKPFLGLKRRGK
jgi:hypothetical protein